MSSRHILPLLFVLLSAISLQIVHAAGFSSNELDSPSSLPVSGPGDITAVSRSTRLAAFQPYVHTLHDLTERRRSTVHFQNRQSILRGAQIGFVNIGHGNLTFTRRDMVIISLLPVVIARIYDSSAGDVGDFGTGWRLSIAETIVPQADGTVLLFDESGSATRFNGRYGSYVQIVPHPSDIVSLNRRNTHIFQLKLSSGIVKRFRLIAGHFRLSRITDRNGNSMRLHYRHGKLVRIDGMNEHFVLFDRDKSGRIAKVTDGEGRSVAYSYDAHGQLIQVLDLGGNAWTYEYSPDGRLGAALDPLRHVDFSVRYDETGRVREVVHRGHRSRYEYAESISRMIDSRDRVATFLQDESGITNAVINHVGVTSSIVLDERNRVTELHRNDVIKATFTYDEHGYLTSSRILDVDGLRTIAYRYNGDGQLVGATDDRGELRLSLRYDPHGNIRLVEKNREESVFRHAPNGALREFWRPDGSRYVFETDADGQITKVTDQEGRVVQVTYLPTGRVQQILFSDGSRHTYGYGDLGLRDFTQPSNAKLLRSYYDASGNLNLLEHVSSDGDIQSDYYYFDETNRLDRVEYARDFVDDTSGNFRELTYDAAGEVVAERIGSDSLQFSYDAQGRLVAVADGKERLVYLYGEDEPDIRLQLDRDARVNLLPWANSGTTIGGLFEVIHNRTRPAPYQTIWLDTDLQVFKLVSDIAVILPNRAIEDSLMRMRLLGLGDSAFSDQAHFTRPSNILFVPPEFRWINCYSPPFPPPQWCKGIIRPISSFGVTIGSPEADLEDNTQCRGGGADSPCDVEQFRDNEAVRWLRLWPVRMEAFERGAAILCEGGHPVTRRTADSGADKCRVTINVSNPALAGQHTHPWFEPEDIPDGADGILCDGRIITEQRIDGQNEANLQFSSGDLQRVRSTRKTLYLRASNGNKVRAAFVVNPNAAPEDIVVDERVVDSL